MEDILSTKANEKKETNEDNLLSLINGLIDFEEYLRPIKSVNDILTKENIEFFKKLLQKENIKINLLLSKIYMNIILNDSLYDDYLISIKENDEDKVDILLQLVENCVSVIEHLKTFVISSNLFLFKNKILSLLKDIYYNLKAKIKNEEKLQKFLYYIDYLPTQFFSNSFLELNKSKDLNEIYKTKEINKITYFEEKFSEINNYYEQYEIFKKFMEYNSCKINHSSIKEEEITPESNSNQIINEEINFYIQYGTLILKFCKYHNYMFLDKEEDKGKKKEEDQDENIRIIFLFDKLDKNDENAEKDKIIQDFLKNKQFISILDSNEYKKIIRKEINHFLKITQKIKNIQRIKIVREHLTYYLDSLDVESYYPLYLKDFSKIAISDTFIPTSLTNIPAGTVHKLYFETPDNEDSLIYIEFYLEDKTKDINFELNKYINDSNKFISIFKEEKIKDTFKFLIFCHGYSLYEIVFDNYYSWFNSKDINYKISILKLMDNTKKEREYNYIINGINYYLDINEINKKKKNKEKKDINIPIILNLNKIKIGFLNNNAENEENKDNNKNEEELNLTEYKEEDEKIIPKYLFNYLIINILKKHKIKDKKQKIIVSIFSQNKDLLLKFPELNEQINDTKTNETENCQDNNNHIEDENEDEKIKYIKNVGFLPENKVEGFNLQYKLYNLNEQMLIYHMYLTITKKLKIAKSLLLIEFDELVVNAVIYNKGEILTKLKDKNFNNINIDNIDEIFYLIKSANNKFDGLEIILGINNTIEKENQKKVLEIIEKIKKYCQEVINPPLKIHEYEQNDIYQDVIKYTNLIYDN